MVPARGWGSGGPEDHPRGPGVKNHWFLDVLEGLGVRPRGDQGGPRGDPRGIQELDSTHSREIEQVAGRIWWS